AFTSWDRLPGRRRPTRPIPHIAPDLAVEILSPSNTSREISRKIKEYFAAGTRLVWGADPEKRTNKDYTNPKHFRTLRVADTLDGGHVLPGFSLSIRDWFAELDRQGGKK